jgi:AbrB family looped-hinge helix DNA binding protein
MIRTAKITSKWQITIPRDIRRILGVRAGDRLLFEESESGFQIRPARQESPFAKYQGIGNPGILSGRRAIVKYLRELRGK